MHTHPPQPKTLWVIFEGEKINLVEKNSSRNILAEIGRDTFFMVIKCYVKIKQMLVLEYGETFESND